MEKRVNDFAPHDGILRVSLEGHASAKRCKSDAFIITYNDMVWLIDGGMRGNMESYERLLELRQAWLGKSRRHKVEDDDYKLHITWLVSHFHLDHVETTIAHTLKSPYIALDEAIIPPSTLLPADYPVNDDARFRPMTEAVVAKYCCGAKITVSDTGRAGMSRRTFSDVTLDIMPPTRDWGAPENIEKLTELYSGGVRDDKRASVTAINSGSMWFMFRVAGRSILFDGDTMKWSDDRDDEPYDEMGRCYADVIGSHVDIVKWSHHGIVRDPAVKYVSSLSPDYIIITSAERDSASARYAADHPGGKAVIVRVGADDELLRIHPDGRIEHASGISISADIGGID